MSKWSYEDVRPFLFCIRICSLYHPFLVTVVLSQKSWCQSSRRLHIPTDACICIYRYALLGLWWGLQLYIVIHKDILLDKMSRSERWAPGEHQGTLPGQGCSFVATVVKFILNRNRYGFSYFFFSLCKFRTGGIAIFILIVEFLARNLYFIYDKHLWFNFIMFDSENVQIMPLFGV